MSDLTFSQRLSQAVRRKGPLCVGLDPRWDMLPDSYRDRYGSQASAVGAFCLRVFELVQPFSGVVKLQAAFFESFGASGMKVMGELMQAAQEMGFVAILDAKRGDIASTAEAYADAAFRIWHADAVTVNPYLGADAVEPFIKRAIELRRGVFILVRTSNPGAGLFQDLICESKPLYHHVAHAVASWNRQSLEDNQLGAVGAVIGATHPRELAELRNTLSQEWILVPGYGAQGGSAQDVKAAIRADGLGAIVSSSRAIVFPFQSADQDWETQIVESAQRSHQELRMLPN